MVVKIDKLILPITIIIASFILGGFFYVSQINKQRSIEKQQMIELQEEKRKEEIKTRADEKEYIAKRKAECYELEQKEREQFNNVKDSFYQEVNDVCNIHYKTNDYDGYTREDCMEEFGMTSSGLDCELGQFTKHY